MKQKQKPFCGIRRPPQVVLKHEQIEKAVLASDSITGEPDARVTRRHMQIMGDAVKAEIFMHPFILHYCLFNGIPGYAAGKFRQGVRAGNEHKTPPSSSCEELLWQWHEETAHGIDTLWDSTDVATKQAFVRRQNFAFLTIEPFHDANGRVVRVLRQAMNCRLGLPFEIIDRSRINKERADLEAYREKVLPEYS